MISISLLVASLVLLRPADPQTLEVFAAASLRESFRAIALDFERKHPGVSVHLNFGGSQQLAAQINEGAPCDVFGSADQRNLGKIAYDPQSRRVFALNRLVVAIPRDAEGPRSFRDLTGAKSIVLAAPPVPAGGYAQTALLRAERAYGAAWLRAVEAKVVSREQDVREVLAKVELGEADAGIVYVTDVASARGRVLSIPVPDQFQPRIAYPIAAVKATRQAHLARQFIKSVLEPSGQRELVVRGFVSPLGPRNGVWLKIGEKIRLIPATLPRSQWQTVTAVGPDKKPHRYQGVPLEKFLGPIKGLRSISLAGADEYQVTLSLAQVLRARPLLTPSTPGNLQIILPGLPPHDWVDWLVQITIQ